MKSLFADIEGLLKQMQIDENIQADVIQSLRNTKIINLTPCSEDSLSSAHHPIPENVWCTHTDRGLVSVIKLKEHDDYPYTANGKYLFSHTRSFGICWVTNTIGYNFWGWNSSTKSLPLVYNKCSIKRKV